MRSSRIACVLLPNLAVQVVLRQRPELAGKPVIVGGYPHEHRSVLDASPEALRTGVSPGMSLRRAAGLCPAATFLPLDAALTSAAFASVRAVMETFSPTVEPDPPAAVYLDLTGIDLRMLGRDGSPGEEALLHALSAEAAGAGAGDSVRVGAGSGRFVAAVAAHLADAGGVRIIPAGTERETLAHLPATLLPGSAELQRRLHRFGLRTMGDVAALPLGPVQAQFGRDGLRLWHLAHGDDDRPLSGRRVPERMVREWRFTDAVSSIAALDQACARLLTTLTPELAERYVNFRQLTLTLLLETSAPSRSATERDTGERGWQHTVTLHAPANQPRVALPLLTAALHDLALPGPVAVVRVALHDLCHEDGQQESLFSSTARRVTQLGEAVRQVEARCGRNLLRRIVPVDPRCRIPERRHALVAFQPAGERRP